MQLRWIIVVTIILAATLTLFGVESFETGTVNELGLALALAGIAFAIIIPMISDYVNEPDFEILANDSASNANPPGPKFLNVIIKNKKSLMPDTRAKVTLFLDDGSQLATSGKWGSQPEPVLQLPLNLMPQGSMPNSGVFQGWLTTVLRSVDIPYKGEDYLDFAVKHPGDADFYTFSAWSYQFNLKWPEQRISGQQKTRVLVEVQTGRLRKSREFVIENPSPSLTGFKLKAIT